VICISLALTYLIKYSLDIPVKVVYTFRNAVD
jgi:hypothetical protein